ncbi:hypothetical protein GIB67_028002 [Kingdonia uniflora]|uniref:Pentatricopeptide repeat-containing protein n=1 Tax=Kingdonia uniflora TaxID=39325 RepID=A0A7J7L779_9MAGN|nr:hypothetical protein GIB67_028002 [Kingdonia uniflora]
MKLLSFSQLVLGVFFSQDVLTCVIERIECHGGWKLVELMWSSSYVRKFSVLDSLMRAFLNMDMDMDMVSDALKVLYMMREEGLIPSCTAMNILFKLMLQKGYYSMVRKLFWSMVAIGPRPSNFTLNSMILGRCKKGNIQVVESLLLLMQVSA